MTNNKLFYITLITMFCCCTSKHSEFVSDNYRLDAAKKDLSTENLIVYNNIPLGENKTHVDSIIKSDTTCYSFNSTYYYTIRKAKNVGNSKRDLYYLLGYSDEVDYMGIQKTDELYGWKLSHLKEQLKKEPEFGYLFIDGYLDRLYGANIVIAVNKNNEEKEYKELNGCFCYHSFQDTIYSVSCAFSEYYTKNENINPIINSFKEILSSKYGNCMKSEKDIYQYLPDTTYYSKYFKWDRYLPKLRLRNLNIIDAYSWINGRYEIQLFINKVYNTKEETQEYEFIITYTDNKYLFQKIELLENIKNEKIQQAKDEEFAEKQREQEILEKKSQHQMF